MIEIVRMEYDTRHTLGVMLVNSKVCCFTLERPWLSNQRNVSCIPEGMYTAKMRFSPHFKRDLYELQNVPGRSAILIHPANKVSELQGCIAPGLSFVRDETGRAFLLTSRDALQRMFKMLGDPLPKEVTVLIKAIM